MLTKAPPVASRTEVLAPVAVIAPFSVSAPFAEPRLRTSTVPAEMVPSAMSPAPLLVLSVLAASWIDTAPVVAMVVPVSVIAAWPPSRCASTTPFANVLLASSERLPVPRPMSALPTMLRPASSVRLPVAPPDAAIALLMVMSLLACSTSEVPLFSDRSISDGAIVSVDCAARA